MPVLYHGTDVHSALVILNHGLNSKHLLALQRRPSQLGSGLYTSFDVSVAWFFASMAPGNRGHGYTVIKLSLSVQHYGQLLQNQWAVERSIVNVPFTATQVWFHIDSFGFLNLYADIRPCNRQEE